MKAKTQTANPQNAQKRDKKGTGGIFGWSVLVLFLLGGAWFYSIVSEVGWMGLFPASGKSSVHETVRLSAQPVYKIKKKQEVLGVNVLRIISKRQPEEFLVLDGVSRSMVDRVYGKQPDLVWANLMANQLLKLRQSGDGSSPITVDVQGVKTLNSGLIKHHQKQYPYWQLEVQFKLSNESSPRAYQAAVVRHVQFSQADGAPDNGKDTLVVGYAQKEAFQKDLLPDLMTHLQFDQN